MSETSVPTTGDLSRIRRDRSCGGTHRQQPCITTGATSPLRCGSGTSSWRRSRRRCRRCRCRCGCSCKGSRQVFRSCGKRCGLPAVMPRTRAAMRSRGRCAAPRAGAAVVARRMPGERAARADGGDETRPAVLTGHRLRVVAGVVGKMELEAAHAGEMPVAAGAVRLVETGPVTMTGPAVRPGSRPPPVTKLRVFATTAGNGDTGRRTVTVGPDGSDSGGGSDDGGCGGAVHDAAPWTRPPDAQTVPSGGGASGVAARSGHRAR